MTRFDRYILSQLLTLFGFFALVLVAVYWVNRAVVLFDRLIADGHSALVFLEFSALALPNVVQLVLPMAAFGAAVYVTNRLILESELTVMQATGFSPWRLGRPFAFFGLIATIMTLALTAYLVPASLALLQQRENEISGSVSSGLLREGEFLHPTRGVTLYIRDISPEGALEDVFLSDRRTPSKPVLYTAHEAFLLRSETGPRLVMIEGMAMVLDREDKQLSNTSFADFSYDVSDLITGPEQTSRNFKHISTLELLANSAAVAIETNQSEGRILAEAHGRLHKPILCLVAALIGFAPLLSGNYSRLGSGRQILLAISLLVLIKLIESSLTNPVRANPAHWPLVYIPSVAGIGLVCALLANSASPCRTWWRKEKAAE